MTRTDEDLLREIMDTDVLLAPVKTWNDDVRRRIVMALLERRVTIQQMIKVHGVTTYQLASWIRTLGPRAQNKKAA